MIRPSPAPLLAKKLRSGVGSRAFGELFMKVFLEDFCQQATRQRGKKVWRRKTTREGFLDRRQRLLLLLLLCLLLVCLRRLLSRPLNPPSLTTPLVQSTSSWIFVCSKHREKKERERERKRKKGKRENRDQQIFSRRCRITELLPGNLRSRRVVQKICIELTRTKSGPSWLKTKHPVT
jgi:hypothetical protein